jgi:lipopolysaccharide transport system permease protein
MSIIAIVIYNLNGYDIIPNGTVVLIPVYMVQTAVLGLGVGIIVSSLTTKYRDLILLVSYGMQLWMYLTPIVYPLSKVEGMLKNIIMLNPMSSIIQNYKYALLGIGSFEFTYWIISLMETVLIFLIGVVLFNKVEKTFMDTV